MDIINATNKKQKKINELVRSLILQSRDKITQNIQIETGRISNTRIKEIECFNGEGGKTFVIEASLTSALAGEIDGGIVIKFAKDLENEVENARRLSKLLIDRQQDWINWKKNQEIPKHIRRYPDIVFAPDVIHVVPEVNAMILDFLNGFTSLLQFHTETESRWGYAGYALARLHGSNQQQTNIKLYNPLFKMLSSFIDEKFLDYWITVLEQSKGGVDFIHGDSHLNNILVSPMRIAWIDAIMLPRLDRMDDLGYILSHAVQEFIAKNIILEFGDIKVINMVTRSWVPLILSSYKDTYSISHLYSKIPLDFFLGSHLIIRAALWEGQIAKTLMRLGQKFIYEMPVLKLLEK